MIFWHRQNTIILSYEVVPILSQVKLYPRPPAVDQYSTMTSRSPDIAPVTGNDPEFSAGIDFISQATISAIDRGYTTWVEHQAIEVSTTVATRNLPHTMDCRGSNHALR
jgi:hypothetical protein